MDQWPDVVLSVAVGHHPTRLAAAQRLMAELEKQESTVHGGPKLCVDPEPSGRGCFNRVGAVAWAAIVPGATHHLVLEEDALLVPDFIGRVKEAVAARPDAAIGLFANWGSRTGAAVRTAAICGSPFGVVLDEYMPNQGLVLPVEVGRRLARFLASEADPDIEADLQILPFLRQLDVPPLVVAPNLLEHDTLPSLVGNDGQGRRRSCCVVFDPADGTVGNTPRGPRRIPTVVPYLSLRQRQAVVLGTAADGVAWRASAVEVLTGLGSDPIELATGYAAAKATIAAGDDVEAADRAYQVWLAAVTTGAVMRAAALSDDELSRHRDSPAVRAALSTLAPGLLDSIGVADLSTDRGTDWPRLVQHGFGWGLARFSKVRPPTAGDFARSLV